MTDESSEVALTTVLGATKEALAQQLTLYIPNKDKNHKAIKDVLRWIKEARKILTIFGGGSTSMPPADGTWLSLDKNIKDISELKDKDIVWEKTRIIYAYIEKNRFLKNVGLLREFLHRFGRETNQGEVVLEFDGKFYSITKYDSK